MELARSLIFGLVSLLALHAQISDAGPRPNVVVILADDLGIGEVSAYRQGEAQTPNIDRLAREGMLFTSVRANCTVCSPSRAALLTGKYADRVGVPGVIRTHPENSWGYFDPKTQTLADILGEAGYRTAIVGKWHLGLESPNTPNERGFQHFHGFLGDMMDSYTSHLRHDKNYMRLNHETITPEGHATELIADWAIDFVSESTKTLQQPFFLYLAFNAPHFPIEPPESWLSRVRERLPELPEPRAKSVAFVEHFDAAVGEFLNELDRLGLSDKTLVAFSSDNGGSLPHHQNNDPFRDGKQSHYDGGLRVPFLVRWPGVVPTGSRSDARALLFDLFPTALDAAGCPVPEDIDARSLMPAFQGKPADLDRELYFVRREGGPAYSGLDYHALIHGPWKLMRKDPFNPWELYNLNDDPGEENNLASQRKDLVRQLSARLAIHIQHGGAVAWQPPESSHTTESQP
jgi:arylsulfatase A-like enzyme